MISDFNDFLFAILLWLSVTFFLFYLFTDTRQDSHQKRVTQLKYKEQLEHQQRLNLQQQLLIQNDKEVKALKAQCQQLKLELQQQAQQLKQDFQDETLRKINSLMINYPTAKKMVEVKQDLPAKNLIALLTPLDTLMQTWGFEMIGQPWEKVTFDPQFHQGDSDNIKVGETVYIRFVGYRDGERILYPAKVSKNLPSGIKIDS